jgi:plastocyanin
MKLVAIAAIAAFLAVPAASAGSAATPTLAGLVGPGFNISLKQGGKKVTKLKAGTYQLNIVDKAVDHNFHIIGPGLNKKTSVVKKGTTIWKVTLKKGTYKFVCDPHATFMKGSFTVS